MKPDLKGLRDKIKNSLSNPIVRRDSTYIGGQMLGDILLGRVADGDLDPSVVEAYRLQYPDLAKDHGFVAEVKSMHGDTDALRGFASGVKGKLFEVEYRDYLNHGHLPDGWHAELAHSANNPGWDLAIYKPDGTVDDHLQLKATETLQNVRTHIERYPDVDVVVTGDQAGAVHQAGLDAHVQAVPLDGHGLDHQVDHSIDQAGHGLGFHFPLIGYALLGTEAAIRARRGNPMGFREAAGRGAKTTLASLAGQGIFMLTGTVWASIPAAILARALMEKDVCLERHKNFIEEEVEWSRNWRNGYLRPAKD